MALVSNRTAGLLLLCMAAASLSLVDAGGYRNGHKAPARTEEELYMNYKDATPLQRHEKARRHTVLGSLSVCPPQIPLPRSMFAMRAERACSSGAQMPRHFDWCGREDEVRT